MAKDETTPEDQESLEGMEHLSAEEKSAAEKKALQENENKEEKELTEEEKEEKKLKEEKEEQDRRTRQGQVKKQLEMLASDPNYLIEDVPQRLLDDVIKGAKASNEKLSEKLKVKTENPDEDKDSIKREIKDELKEETSLELELNKLGDKEAESAQETYEDFRSHGYSAREARVKTVAMHNIPSDDEYSISVGRSHRVGGQTRTKIKTRADETAEFAQKALPKEFQS
jgi:hypothetical protein